MTFLRFVTLVLIVTALASCRMQEYYQDYLDKNPNGYCHLPKSLFEFAKKAKMGK